MKIISGVYWDKGRRNTNQDSLLFEQVNTKKGRIVLAAVSDGIGGLQEGETASGFILEKLLQNFYHQVLFLAGRGRGRKALRRSFLRCFFETNRILNRYAQSREIRLGATISVLLVFGRRYLIAHLGDSRIYRVTKKGDVFQLTKDHCLDRNALTKCMGSFSYQSPDICEGRIRGKNGFLLCSDGFYHHLTDDMIGELLNPEEAVAEEQIEKRLREIAGHGLKQGEQDNMTALYVRCGG